MSWWDDNRRCTYIILGMTRCSRARSAKSPLCPYHERQPLKKVDHA